MKGNLTSITNDCGDRVIVVRIYDPDMPHCPNGYIENWRENPEHLVSCPSFEIEKFGEYEEKMENYHKTMDVFESFQIGDVDITQKRKGEKEG
ncbi:MAG: hypothetical protein KAS87_06475 [Candidatus Omnitrophica bacterium]|nr:hypothetical protein [Candidatus Omnitrophota bacterium]